MASDTSPHIYGQLNLSTVPRQDWERSAFSTTSTGATGYPHAKHEVGPSWHTHPPKYRP